MALSVPRLLPTKTYPFSDIRHTLAATGIQAGVMATGAVTEFKVTQDTGSNMNVKIAAGDSGAWVTGLDTTRQGAYHVYNDAIITTAVSAANATNPRIDQVVLRVYDSNVIGGGTDAATIEVIAGTATSGATLDNRTGAANLATIAAPKSLLRLADILVPASSTAVTNANIRDRRPWAVGGLFQGVQLAGADYNTVSTSTVAIDATNLSKRVECTGVPLVIELTGEYFTSIAANLDLYVDTVFTMRRLVPNTAGADTPLSLRYLLNPAVGSHVLELRWSLSAAGSATIRRGSTYGVGFRIEELVRQNTSND